MVHGNPLSSYQKAQTLCDEVEPNKLILMLYEGAIKRIALAKEGIKKADPKMRGENLGKAIAIIAELNASLDSNIKTKEINFLRDLYATMLTELPKVSVSEDIEALELSEKYLMELKRIWETTVMKNSTTEKQKSAKKMNKTGYPNTNSYTGGNRTTYSGQPIAI